MAQVEPMMVDELMSDLTICKLRAVLITQV